MPCFVDVVHRLWWTWQAVVGGIRFGCWVINVIIIAREVLVPGFGDILMYFLHILALPFL